MRVLLINPQTPDMISNKEYYIPSSLLYLAAALQKAWIKVNILDLNVCQPKKYDEWYSAKWTCFLGVHKFQPTLVGFGCLFSGQFPSVLHYAKMIKNGFPDVSIVIGGIHPTIFPTEILTNCPSIDYVILGEGEESIVQLARVLEYYSLDELEQIDGLAYRQNGKVVVNPKTSFISDLDAIPFPAYDLINLEDYYHDTSKWHNPRNLPINASVPILTSRSCPMRCNFCSMFLVMGTKWRCRTPHNVVDEIAFLYDNYGHQHFSFMDDNLTINKKHVLELCDEIVRRGLYIQFETPNGISTRFLDEEILDALVTAGLVRVSLAIESGSDFIRNQIMGKGLSTDKIFEIVQLTKKYYDLYVRAFFMMGMPEETRETLRNTYNMIEAIDVDKPIVSNVMPYPGTKLFEQALRDNLFVDDLDLNNLWQDDRFYFTDNKRFFIKPYKLEIEELQEFRGRFDSLIETLIDEKVKEKGYVTY